MLVIRLEDQGVLETPVRKLVTTSADLTYLSELGQSWLNKEDTTILVSSDVGQTELLSFANAQVFKEGFYCNMTWVYRFMLERMDLSFYRPYKIYR